MFRHRLKKTTTFRTRFHWYLLSFLAGGVNAGGFLAAHRFVSHVTGFATLFGIGAASGNWAQAIGILTVPGYFLAGVMISAYLVDAQISRGKRPHYTLVMSLVFLCLLLATLGGSLGYFGEFGSEPRLKQSYVLLALLCMASGLQNAAISSASGTTVRTTHLTGIITDLGTSLVRAFTNRDVYDREMKLSRVRLGTIISFGAGSAVGAYFFLKYLFLGFILPTTLAAYAVYATFEPTRRLAKVRRSAREKLS